MDFRGAWVTQVVVVWQVDVKGRLAGSTVFLSSTDLERLHTFYDVEGLNENEHGDSGT